MDNHQQQLAMRVLVLADQFGHVVKDIRRYVVQGDEVQDEGDEQVARAELEDDLADLVTQVRVLAGELGYTAERFQMLIDHGRRRMADRKREYAEKGWTFI